MVKSNLIINTTMDRLWNPFVDVSHHAPGLCLRDFEVGVSEQAAKVDDRNRTVSPEVYSWKSSFVQWYWIGGRRGSIIIDWTEWEV